MTPTVSIIVPCYNEQATIRMLLDAIREQTYPREDIEVIISDGHSTDDTRNVIAAFQARYGEPVVVVVDNHAGSIPAALNRALEAARGEIIVRLDAHSMPYPEYVARCVQAVREGRGDNVGGVWEVRPAARTWMAESIAVAAAHPLGAGDALYRLTPQAGAVDTVPFGSFRRTLVEQIGLFDETLLANEDYEFNTRVRRSGGTVWLDPAIRSVYFARPTLMALARQYWRYGLWKWRMLKRYPSTIRWRQALPPLFVSGLAALAISGIWFAPARAGLILEISIYFTILLLAGLLAAIRSRKWYLIAGLPLSICVMHLAWGGGFLWSVFSAPWKQNNG